MCISNVRIVELLPPLHYGGAARSGKRILEGKTPEGYGERPELESLRVVGFVLSSIRATIGATSAVVIVGFTIPALGSSLSRCILRNRQSCWAGFQIDRLTALM